MQDTETWLVVQLPSFYNFLQSRLLVTRNTLTIKVLPSLLQGLVQKGCCSTRVCSLQIHVLNSFWQVWHARELCLFFCLTDEDICKSKCPRYCLGCFVFVSDVGMIRSLWYINEMHFGYFLFLFCFMGYYMVFFCFCK